ncbi:YqcC family protein [Edwardsiella anguillarum]|nr:YqcC family protein [Edwardsiella anguillarum]
MSDYAIVHGHLQQIEAQMRALSLWQAQAPAADALASQEPFCVDTWRRPNGCSGSFTAHARPAALQSAPAAADGDRPYIEMAYPQELARVAPLLAALQRLDRHLGGDPR